MPWYALFVQTGEEEKVEKLIEKKFDQSIQCLNPKRIVPEKRQGVITKSTKLLFPGYLFLKLELTKKIYYELLDIPKVYYMVKYGRDKKDSSLSYFSSIPDNEINWLLTLINKNDTLIFSDVLINGEDIIVLSGPLVGLESKIKKIKLIREREEHQ
ncbi:antiterminator LoaP [Paenibacillus sp. Dod16]|uniref:antiterminator LoaP n=1 Tax=Paenibacillus sp. Dod16 TaxID=3416392 RepID=UPI003CEF525D